MDRLVDALVPGMPAAARTKIIGQAQGNPLFAVETVRALIDRDIVQPVEGVYRLFGDIGELAVPDSLHALLAARLDALAPRLRQLVGDAAVLGTTFPADALTAVSGLDHNAVRAGLAELVRREVLTVSADPLSPERGSYQFAQQMLRQVAYDTLSRRDRKTRHLKVAAHLRQAFPGDGEEVADVIARHYLDALRALPDDADAEEIRGRAITALIRAAERAERTGAPARAATSYATAAELGPADAAGEHQAPEECDAGALWERAAEAAVTDADYATAIEHASRARDHYLRRAQARAAARAQATVGQAMRLRGRHAEARDQLTAAVEVLSADPDIDTVRALQQLAMLDMGSGSPDADRLTTEALTLGQVLDVGPRLLCQLLIVRGIHLSISGRWAEAAAYLREGARLGAQNGDNMLVGRAQVNMSDALMATDPAAAAEAARTAVRHLRQAGARYFLAAAIVNLTNALRELGEWDAAEAECVQAAESGEMADVEYLACQRGWHAALRGDAASAEILRAALHDLPASEDVQDKAMVILLEAFTAVARGQPREALGHARRTLACAEAVGVNHECSRWAWPLAARAADELQDTAAVEELLALLDAYRPGQLAPMLRAERSLARARLQASRGDPGAMAAFADAITSLREHSTPYHLAHGLIDHAEYLTRHGDAEAAARAIDEARTIGRRLRCQPLLDRASAAERADSRVRA
jgi:predicted ATPase